MVMVSKFSRYDVCSCFICGRAHWKKVAFDMDCSVSCFFLHGIKKHKTHKKSCQKHKTKFNLKAASVKFYLYSPKSQIIICLGCFTNSPVYNTLYPQTPSSDKEILLPQNKLIKIFFYKPQAGSEWGLGLAQIAIQWMFLLSWMGHFGTTVVGVGTRQQ